VKSDCTASTAQGAPHRQIRALYDDRTIRVYQAYSDQIADAALAHGTFVSPPFKMERMTWIKPSFLWMMYRAGWGSKDAGQSRILAIDITREGFEWALAHSCLSHPDESMSQEEWSQFKASAPVRIQWDSERAMALRSIRIAMAPARSATAGTVGREPRACQVPDPLRE
jgi:hypothetical protein